MRQLYSINRVLMRGQAIVVQRLVYGNVPPATALVTEDELEQALALAG